MPEPDGNTREFPRDGSELSALQETAAFALVPAEPPQRPLPGSDSSLCIPGYEVLDVLGRGGMGIVYRARQLALNRIVALKMIRFAGASSDSDHARFQAEAEAIARLQHPNVVQIYEIGAHQGLPYFSLEFCGGSSLAKRLAGTPLAPPEAARLTQTLARAMHAVHQRNIVHRDLKPANVLLAEDGSPKIADFGLVKYLGERGDTATGAIVGTPSYMAPEQAGGGPTEVGPACDVYALGAILYECLTGRPPFNAASPVDVLRQVCSTEPVPPRQLNAKVSRDLETICLKCLRKQPASRYLTAEALADDLHRHLSGQAIQARPVGTAERVWRWCQRNPSSAAAAAFGVALVVAAIAVPLWVASVQGAAAESLEKERDVAKAALKETQRLAARLALDRAVDVAQGGEGTARGDVAVGMLWLARGDEMAPNDDDDVHHFVRASLPCWQQQLYRPRLEFDLGHAVRALAVTPDGLVAVAASGGEARIIDLASGRQIGALAHPDLVTAVSLHPDGATVLTGSHDKTLRRWLLRSGEPSGRPLTLPAAIDCMALAPDGQEVLVGCDDGTVRRYRLSDGALLQTVPQSGRFRAAAWSKDGRTYATGSYGDKIYLWDTASGAGRDTITNVGQLNCLDFSPDGRLLAVNDNWRVRLSDVETRQFHQPELLHRSPVRVSRFTADGRFLFSAGLDYAGQLWDVATGRPAGSPLEHGEPVETAAIGRDGELLTGTEGGVLRVWKSGTRIPKILRTPDWQRCSGIAVHPDGIRMAVAARIPQVQLRDVRTGEPLGPKFTHPGPVYAVTFSRDGRCLLTCGDGAIPVAQMWDVERGVAIGKPLPHRALVQTAAISPDGRHVLTSAYASLGHPELGYVQLWDATSQEPVGAPFPGGARTLAFSPDGNRFAVGRFQIGEVRDLASGRKLYEITDRRTLTGLAFTPDGNDLLTCSNDQTIRLRDARSGELIGAPLESHGYLEHLALSPDGRTFAVGANNGNACQLWDRATRRPLGPPLFNPGHVSGLSFAEQGRRLLATTWDGEVRSWAVPLPLDLTTENVRTWVEEAAGQEFGPGDVPRRRARSGQGNQETPR